MHKQTVRFEILPEHIKLMDRLQFRADTGTDWDEPSKVSILPAISQKRPFGNSGVETDAAEILGIPCSDGLSPEDRKTVLTLLAGLPVALEAAVAHKTFKPGTYEISRYGAWFSYREAMSAIFWMDAVEACAAIKDPNGDGMADRMLSFAMSVTEPNPYRLLEYLNAWTAPVPQDHMTAVTGIFERAAVRHYRSVHPDDRSTDGELIERLQTRGDPHDGSWPFHDDK